MSGPVRRFGLRLLVVVGLQTIVLAAIVADRQWLLDSGAGVVLATVPVDPRSLFQGDYARLRYAVSRVPLDLAEEPPEVGDTVYVELAPGDAAWDAVALRRDRRAIASDHVAMRGTVTTVQSRCPTGSAQECPAVELSYGIETYFVPEGTGRDLERPTSDKTVTVEVAVDAKVGAAIRAVLVNGRPWREETFF